jgi:hypothetical protein
MAAIRREWAWPIRLTMEQQRQIKQTVTAMNARGSGGACHADGAESAAFSA